MSSIPGEFSLQCSDYEIWVVPRGGRGTIGRLTGWDSLSYTPGVLNAVSQATVRIPNAAEVEPECCGIITSVRAWAHELSIRRGQDGEVWCGPVVQQQISGGAYTITAFDIAKWQERRFLHGNYAIKAMDALHLYQTLWHDAYDVDNSMRATLTLGNPTGVLVDFAYQSEKTGRQTSDQALRQTGIAAVDWYTKLRETFAGAAITTFASSSLLSDQYVVGAYDTSSDGSQTVNDLVVQGTNRGGKQIAAEGVANADLRALDGYLEAVEQDQTLQSIGACKAAVTDLLALYQDTPTTVSNLILSPRAPYRLSELAPGYLLNVALSRMCKRVLGIYRIQSVTVTVDSGQNNGMEIPNLALQFEAPAVAASTGGPV